MTRWRWTVLFLSAALVGGCNGCGTPVAWAEDAGETLDAGDGPDAGGLCEPGAQRCEDGLLWTCSAEVDWVSEDCGPGNHCVEGVTEGRCEPLPPVCFAGELSCTDAITVSRCDDDGQGTTAIEICDTDAGFVCSFGACRNACVFNEALGQSAGCEFFPVALLVGDATHFGIVASNANPWPATVTLADADGVIESRVIAGGELARFVVDASAKLLGAPSGIDRSGRGRVAYHLTASLPVAAYQFNPLDRAEQRQNDASLLLPKNVLGEEYMAMAPRVVGDALVAGASIGMPIYLAVVAAEADTEITVHPTVRFEAGTGVPPLTAGVPYTTTLAALEVLQLAAVRAGSDITGTRITSNKPVSVYTGAACISIPQGAFFCDHLEEVLFPVANWGERYALAPFRPRGELPEDTTWQILALRDGTTVTAIGDDPPVIPILDAGESNRFSRAGALVITASGPVQIAQYMHSQGAVSLPLAPIYNEPFESEGCVPLPSSSSMGDPSQLLVVPTAQYRNDYVFLAPDTYRYDFITIVSESSEISEVWLDETMILPEWTEIGGGFRYTHLRITDGSHGIRMDIPFSIDVHGYDCMVSYAYPGGLNLRPIVF